jgi:hypothetical protein
MHLYKSVDISVCIRRLSLYLVASSMKCSQVRMPARSAMARCLPGSRPQDRNAQFRFQHSETWIIWRHGVRASDRAHDIQPLVQLLYSQSNWDPRWPGTAHGACRSTSHCHDLWDDRQAAGAARPERGEIMTRRGGVALRLQRDKGAARCEPGPGQYML